jgi:hypothetical protein
VAKALGLRTGNTIKVSYADGRKAQRRQAEGAYVELVGRHGTFTAIVEPRRKTALIGAIVLEDLDLLVDCQHQRLIPAILVDHFLRSNENRWFMVRAPRRRVRGARPRRWVRWPKPGPASGRRDDWRDSSRVYQKPAAL